MSQISVKEQAFFLAGQLAPSIIESNNPIAFYMSAWWDAANDYSEQVVMLFGVTPVY